MSHCDTNPSVSEPTSATKIKGGRLKVLTNGIIKENPVFVLLLGTCPALAISTGLTDAIGMGLAATFVLIVTNILISLLRNIIPDRVRIPCYIVLIAGAVTVVQLLLKAYIPSLYDALGIYLPLITVNCIILGRAEMFANKNKVLSSFLDGVGMGLGFTIALVAMALLREVIGAGTFFGLAIPWLSDNGVRIMTMAPGGFIVYGVLIAVISKLLNKKPPAAEGCAGCPVRDTCVKSKRAEVTENA